MGFALLYKSIEEVFNVLVVVLSKHVTQYGPQSVLKYYNLTTTYNKTIPLPDTGEHAGHHFKLNPEIDHQSKCVIIIGHLKYKI